MLASTIKLRYALPFISSVIFFATLIDAQLRESSCYQFDGNGRICTTLINATIVSHFFSTLILFFMDRYNFLQYLFSTPVLFFKSTYTVWIVVILSWYLFIGVTINYCIGWILEKVIEKIYQTFLMTQKYQSVMKVTM